MLLRIERVKPRPGGKGNTARPEDMSWRIPVSFTSLKSRKTSLRNFRSPGRLDGRSIQILELSKPALLSWLLEAFGSISEKVSTSRPSPL